MKTVNQVIAELSALPEAEREKPFRFADAEGICDEGMEAGVVEVRDYCVFLHCGEFA